MTSWIKLLAPAAGGSKRLLLVVVLIAAVVAPHVVSPFYLDVLLQIMIFGLFAMSMDMLIGYTGLVTLGHAGIYGVAAYVIAYSASQQHWDAALAVPAALGGALLTSVVFGLLAIRTSGVSFLLVTLAEGMVVWGIAYRWASVTGAENGIGGFHRPALVSQPVPFYYAVLVVLVICSLLMYRVVRSPFGLTLQGIRENQLRMRTLGYNILLHKFLIFVIAGLFAGVAGILFAYYNQFMSPNTVNLAQSVQGLLMVILGGPGTLFGAVLGSAVVVGIQNVVSLYTERWITVMGIIFVPTVLLARHGLIGRFGDLAGLIARARARPAPTVPEQPAVGYETDVLQHRR